MRMEQQSTTTSVPVRLLVAAASALALPELALRFLENADVDAPGTSIVRGTLGPVLARYVPLRALAAAHPLLATLGGILAVVVAFTLARAATRLWFNELRPGLAGTHFEQQRLTFPVYQPDLLELVSARPP